MARTTLTLSDEVMRKLRLYAVKTNNSTKAQSKVVEAALIEYFAKHESEH